MDNRFRFLYPVYTELWGRGEITRAGRGKPGAAAGLGGRQIPSEKPGGSGPNERVGKLVKALPRKAAIAVYGPVP